MTVQSEDHIDGGATPQFDIPAHYDVMEQLDRDVHDDRVLSRNEALAALGVVTEQLGRIPSVLFMPCFGTGRHIKFLLEAGVERIIGVDLSPVCVAKAQRQFDGDSRVELYVGDLSDVSLMAQFANVADAVILLGNSFADVINPELLARVTYGMCSLLKPGGVMVMDYVSNQYMGRAIEGTTSTWTAELDGRRVNDNRTPRYEPSTGVMTIDVLCTYADGSDAGTPAWTGFYQKRILDPADTCNHFSKHGDVDLQVIGPATEVNLAQYANIDVAELGMIGASLWFAGKKRA